MNTSSIFKAPWLAVCIAALLGGVAPAKAVPPVTGPGDVPDYYSTPNWAISPPLRKFVDPLPGIPAAHPDIVTFPGSDYYEISLREYTKVMHADLPGGTRLRGYVQVNAGTDTTACTDPSLNLANPCTAAANTVAPEAQDYLGPLIVATKNRPVRVKFVNDLPTGSAGKLFVPVDTTVMGSGDFEINYDPVTKEPAPTALGVFSQNRATLHLHGGRSPWISDGTPHQWITPAGEATTYPKGVSVTYVPDMWFDAAGNVIPSCAGSSTCAVPGASNNPGPGAETFYWTNQQSGRLMFYHDHAWGITRLNVYVGEAAGYLITDDMEQQMIAPGGLLADVGYGTPLVIQDKTFVDPATIVATDPTWAWGSQPWTGVPGDPSTPVLGDLWWPHVYMPAQNPFNPDLTGVNAMGRWMYGPWFWPPTPVCGSDPTAVVPWCVSVGTLPNPYYDCGPGGPCTRPEQPPEIPGTPNVSWGAEAFLDTMVVNGAAYPTYTVDPRAYRFRILNASHDRFLNLQLYQAVSKVGYTNPTVAPYVLSGPATDLTEVAMVPAAANPTFPPLWPTDGREGGVPDPALSGPAFIQIGTEGGLLPAPVLLNNQPVRWNMDPTMFNVGNVLPQPDGGGTLILGPAERADVIVDFSNFAGKTLILYNDAPAAFPALDPHYDFYTGAPDRTGIGGAPAIPPGVGPNVRTVMQIVVSGAGGAAPVNDFSPATLTALQTAFQSSPGIPGVFAASQEPIVVGQRAYGTAASGGDGAYDAVFPGTWPYWGLSRIFDNFLSFLDVNGTPTTVPMKPKSIHDEMGGTFDEFGRMSAKLGLEVPSATAAISTFALQNFVDPPTEILDPAADPGGVQVWKITHNGVDTHPIHFHLFDVQVINRVGWDGFIRLPDPNELGWKDTVRVAPLEDTIVALRPIVPQVPFPLPDSVRPLNPEAPTGSMMGFSQIDPLTGGALPTPTENVIFDFGWEYVWHCHILSHEENDMMRAMVLKLAPEAPTNLLAVQGAGGVNLAWTDNAASETGYTLERADDPGFATGLVAFSPPAGVPATAYNVPVSYFDATAAPGTQYYYRVQAFSANGVSAWSNVASVFVASSAMLTPATLAFGNQPLFTASAPQTATLSNPGSAVLNILGIGITGANAADFSQVSTCGATLGPGLSCAISVTFTPSAIGARSGSLDVATDAPGLATLSVALSGTGASPVASVSPTALVFATQYVNTTSPAQVLTLNNAGNAPLVIAGITITGTNPADFARTTTCGASLAPAANCTISVTFTPTAGGPLAAAVTIASNDPVNPSLVVPLSGTGLTRPIAGVAPTSLVFPSTVQGTTSAPQTVTLSNTGTAALLVSSYIFTGDFAADPASNCGATLAVGASCTVAVTFTPTATGARTGTLAIASNDPVNALLTVNLSGTAVAPVAALQPLSMTFATQLLGTTSPAQAALLSNTGTSPLLISSVGFTGTNAASFGQSNSCGASLAVGATCSILVTFTPTVSGPLTAALAVASNDPVNPTVTVQLAGTGIALPAAPSGVVATPSVLSLLPPTVTVSWLDNASNEDGFTIQRANDPGFTVGVTSATVAANTNRYLDASVLQHATYYYRVQAFHAYGVSAWVYAGPVTTPGQRPAAPTGLALSRITSTALTATWTDNATNETTYYVYNSVVSNIGPWRLIATLPANSVSYRSTALTPNTRYWYRVRCSNADGYSPYSNIVSVRTLP